MTELERNIYIAQQIHKAVQLTLVGEALDDDSAMEVAEIYPAWVTGKAYAIDNIVRYGVNVDNEARIFRVIQAHTSQEDWRPDATPALYKEIGIADDGVPVWTQPYGATDAYQKGDRVHYPDKESPIYVSLIDGNVWSPADYPQGWEVE